MKGSILLSLLLVGALAFTACETAPRTGMAIGAPAGAALGAITGAAVAGHGDRGEGALLGGLIGAGVGTAAGYGTGKVVERRNSVIVQVPTDTGGYRDVRMVYHQGRWRGPKGEFYDYVPSPEQLRSMYGY